MGAKAQLRSAPFLNPKKSVPKQQQNVETFLLASEPLTYEAAQFLVTYEEEDDRIDYKLTFDPDSEREWLEITKDVSAFANTYGGYLVFGVEDQTKEISSLDDRVVAMLLDVNNVQQKLNRHLEPALGTLRAKKFEVDGESIVLLLIPQSKNRTHIIRKDGSFKYPSGQKKTVLYKGTFYVRRNASNHLGDSRDLEDVIERRIDQFREALLDKVAKVVRAPVSSEVYMLSKDEADQGEKKFVLEASSDATAVKGMSFTVPPEGASQEVAAWTALAKGAADTMPPVETLWHWYAERNSMELVEEYRLSVFTFMLWGRAPQFFWIQGMDAKKINEYLFEAVRSRPNNRNVEQMLLVAAFLGKGTYRRTLDLLGAYKQKLSPRMREFPAGGPRSIFRETTKPRGIDESTYRAKRLEELDAIVAESQEGAKIPNLAHRDKALKLDRFLYAQDDGYK